jgi:1-acyl-sn-glycerol-3-phosphate acyltransferase
MTPLVVILLGLLLWLLLVVVGNIAVRNPRGDVPTGLAWVACAVYVRVYHRLRVRGREHIPPRPEVDGRPIIVVANHTAGVDPVLIQSALPFFVRWMMADDMRTPRTDPLFEWLEVIMIDRTGRADLPALRAALSTLRERRAALGVFPEGRLHRRRGELLAFQPGVGVLVSRSGALVLPAIVRGTPHCRGSWTSLFIPSASRLTFMPLIDYRGTGLTPGQIAADLHARYRRWLGEGR